MLMVWMRKAYTKKLMDSEYLMSIIINLSGWTNDELLDLILKIYKNYFKKGDLNLGECLKGHTWMKIRLVSQGGRWIRTTESMLPGKKSVKKYMWTLEMSYATEESKVKTRPPNSMTNDSGNLSENYLAGTVRIQTRLKG